MQTMIIVMTIILFTEPFCVTDAMLCTVYLTFKNSYNMGSLTILALWKKTLMLKFKKKYTRGQNLSVAEVGFKQNLPDSKTHPLNVNVIFCYAVPFGTQTQASLNGCGQGERLWEKRKVIWTETSLASTLNTRRLFPQLIMRSLRAACAQEIYFGSISPLPCLLKESNT